MCQCRSERGATGATQEEAIIRDTGAASHFTTLYSGLLGRDNWILVEPARDAIPARITIRKSDGRALIDACSPFEIPYATFAALVADNMVSYAGPDGPRGDIYRPEFPPKH